MNPPEGKACYLLSPLNSFREKEKEDGLKTLDSQTYTM
jgi:hypothetical protein